MERQVRTFEEVDEEAARLIATLSPKEKGATLVTLTGELGAGKTVFVKSAAKALGIGEIVTSPTFVLEKIYLLPEGNPFKRLVHIDAYRLGKGSDLAPLGFDELMKERDSLVMLEWPERVADALPTADTRITITIAPDESRVISYE